MESIKTHRQKNTLINFVGFDSNYTIGVLQGQTVHHQHPQPIITMKGLAYNIPTPASSSHILPINKVVYSSTQRELFTAGRDGSVKVWEEERCLKTRPIRNQSVFTTNNPQEEALKLETSISGSPVPFQRNGGGLKIKESYNIHNDWVNDIQMVGDLLVSCSSDLGIKIISPNGAVANLQNDHRDYIKRICYDNNELISGSLDKNIIIHDLEKLTARAKIMETQGIYALSACEYLIAAGGQNVVNLYDSRSQMKIRSLIGHQSTIRGLIQDANYLITASSDTTIKMWDLRTFKVYKNFDIHDYPVWALEGDSNCFYLGDRGGNIVKTDLSNMFANKNESDFNSNFNFNFTTNECASIDEKLGVSTIVAKNDSPILSICHNEDSIFISDYDSLTRYVNPDTSTLAQYQFLKTCLDYSPSDEMDEAQPNDDLNSMFHDLVSHLSVDSDNELQSNYSVEQAEPAESYISMFLNVNGGPSIEFVNAYQLDLTVADECVDTTPIEILLNPTDQITPIPFNLKPISRYEIVPLSVVSKRILNNKRQIMALYLNGDIRMWDILICKELKKFPSRQEKLLTGKELEFRIKEMDDLVQKYQSLDTLNNWCEVEIKAGKLLVTVKETSVMNVEIYYDDMVKDYPYLAIDHPETIRRMGNHKTIVGDDDRFHLGLILLNSIFHGYAMVEWVFDELLREELGKQEARSTPVGPLNEFISISEESLAKSLPQYNDSIMSLLQTNKKLYLEKPKESVLRVNHVNPCLGIEGGDDELRYFPVINANHFPSDMKVTLFEYSPELGNYRDLSYFKISDIDNLPDFPQQDLINELRCLLPRWIGQPILYNRFNVKESPKITFRLLEVDYFKLPPSIKIGGKSQRKIKSLPALESSIKLTSHNMLRVSKILQFLTDKFESSTKEMKDKKLKPTDWLVLECKGQELSNSMTLQTIKTRVWKSSTDIELRYRRRLDT